MRTEAPGGVVAIWTCTAAVNAAALWRRLCIRTPATMATTTNPSKAPIRTGLFQVADGDDALAAGFAIGGFDTGGLA